MDSSAREGGVWTPFVSLLSCGVETVVSRCHLSCSAADYYYSSLILSLVIITTVYHKSAAMDGDIQTKFGKVTGPNGQPLIIKLEKASIIGHRQLNYGFEYDNQIPMLPEGNLHQSQSSLLPECNLDDPTELLPECNVSYKTLLLPESRCDSKTSVPGCNSQDNAPGQILSPTLLNGLETWEDLYNLDIFDGSCETVPTEIKVFPCEKKKNPPYLVEDKDITTKNMTPVIFNVTGIKEDDVIHTSLRYSEALFKKRVVSPCKLHVEFHDRPENLPEDYCFYTISDSDRCEYITGINSNPTGLITISSHTDSFKFNIVFLCLNSCHREFGKQIELHISIYSKDGQLKKEEMFTVRVCKNVKRDHREKNCVKPVKRKISLVNEKDKPVKCKKKMKVEADSCSTSAAGPSSLSAADMGIEAKQEVARCYMFKMKSKRQEELILGFIEEMDGELTMVEKPVLEGRNNGAPPLH